MYQHMNVRTYNLRNRFMCEYSTGFIKECREVMNKIVWMRQSMNTFNMHHLMSKKCMNT